MRKVLFKTLAALNRVLLPSFINRDLTRLSKGAKLIVAWRYWVTCNALE